MRTYFFGDIHGNLPALEACLKHLDSLRPDAVFCLGDIAGWLPFGDEIYARFCREGFPTVAGNHDLLIAGAITDHPNQLDRIQATAYNAGLLSRVSGAIDYFLNLPLSIEKEEITIVHHSPFSLLQKCAAPAIDNFGYLDEAAMAELTPPWREYGKRLIVSGHDHFPAIFELPERGDIRPHRFEPDELSLTVQINPDSRYWVKAGSVGGPYRDGIPAANSVLYDSSRGTIMLFRIPFDTKNLLAQLSSHRFFRNLPTIKKYIETLRTSASV